MDKNKLYSDRRLKETIEEMSTAVCRDMVDKLPVSRYTYKNFMCYNPNPPVIGFMAEDVREVFPNAVGQSDQLFPVFDENGNPVYDVDEFGNEEQRMFEIKDVLDITLTEALPTLWGSCQELSKQVKELKAKVEALEAK